MTLVETTPQIAIRQTAVAPSVQLYPSTEFHLRLRERNEGQTLLKRYAARSDHGDVAGKEAQQIFSQLVDAEEFHVDMIAKTAAPDVAGIKAKLQILISRLEQLGGAIDFSPFENTSINLARSALEDASILQESMR